MTARTIRQLSLLISLGLTATYPPQAFAADAKDAGAPLCDGTNADCDDALRGRVRDNRASYPVARPPSSEAELATLRASGLTPSQLQRLRAAGAQPQPSAAAPAAASAQTAPAPAPLVVGIDDSGQANFASGSAELTPAGRSALDALAQRLQGVHITRLRIVGHTDSQRISKSLRSVYADNQALSEARAATVAGYLMRALHLRDDQIAIRGEGARAPAATGGDAASMARNRRVDITVWGERAQPVAVAPAVPAPVPAPAPQPAPTAQLPCGPAQQAAVPALDAQNPLRISVDGQPDKGGGPQAEADRARCVDVALATDRVQIHADALQLQPALNVWAVPQAVVRGQPVIFRMWSNYSAFIRSAQVRIFAPEQTTPLAEVALDADGSARWTPPANAPAQLSYVLRVRDAQGRFDDTVPRPLTLLDRERPSSDRDRAEREAQIGYGKNNRGEANMAVRGGTVTINGQAGSAQDRVTALGATVPVGRDGRFVTQQILPYGAHAVRVDITAPDGAQSNYQRDVVLDAPSWFTVGMADLTVGHGSVTGNPSLVDPLLANTSKNTFADGRLAFFSQGELGSGLRLTASADTREQPLNHLFSNFASKDPHYLLRRFDSDQLYPVYGDDSTLVEAAPTQGKFYLKAERDGNHALWGNFTTAWTGSDLLQYSRGLYGAEGLWKSPDTTAAGERRTSINGFAADPGTVGGRDEFRGTGGSLYYLRRQDITVGSERVWVEVRDRDSGLVLQRVLLVPGSDYDINYLQGRILLTQPLSSVADGSGLVRNGSLSGNPAYLVTTYEFVPGMTAVDQLATGLRAEHWVNDHLRLGLTHYRQTGDGIGQRLGGVDATLRYTPNTWLRAELARSEGNGLGTTSSLDGGFDFATQQVAPDSRANARRVEAALSLADLHASLRGTAQGYWKQRDAGFSAPGQIALGGEAVTQRGARADVPLAEHTRVQLKFDQRLATSQNTKAGEAALVHELTPQWTLSAGVRSDQRGQADTALILSPILTENGSRTDAAVKADYHPQPADATQSPPAAAPWNVYAFGQGTLARSGTRSRNDRVGLGNGWQATERLRLESEISGGNGGLGGKLGGNYRHDDRSNTYLSYAMETERPDLAYSGRFGTLLLGNRTKLNDRVSLYEETRRTTGFGHSGLLQAFGVDLAPTDRWSTGLKAEAGTVSDPLNGDIRRRALALSAGYKDDATVYSGALEYRHDVSNLTGTRNSWLLRNSYGQQLTPGWRLLGKLNLARSSNTQGQFYDGDFTEGVIGAAYRPVEDDRWNTLVKYTYFQNLPSPGQLAPSSGVFSTAVADYSQKSQVFAVDTLWDVRPWLTLGAKFGYRWGSLKPTRTEGTWFDSSADLLVLRAEGQLVRNWSGLVEWRRLHAKEAGDTKSGALLAAYYRINANVKAGLGYNFTDFSDDLTNLSYTQRGVFLNVLASY